MNVVLAGRYPNRMLPGMGAVSAGGVNYHDTGEGITPENWEQRCCGFWQLFAQSTVGEYLGSSDACNHWREANRPLFGSYDPCERDGIDLMQYPSPPGPATTSGPAPDVVTGRSAEEILTEQARRGADENRTALDIAIRLQYDARCVAMKAQCNRFQSVSSDCGKCEFDPLNLSSILMIVGIVGAAGLAVKLVKDMYL